jgi:hypothetical protein
VTANDIQDDLKDQINRWVVGDQQSKGKLADTINELIEARIKEALADVRVIGDQLWDGS